VGFLRFDGTRVVGVQARTGSASTHRDYSARREVVVCGGAVESTLLLERSGIGRPSALGAAGIRVRVESPNLGERVIEQRGVGLHLKLRGDLGPTAGLDTVARQAVQGLRFLATRRGPIATAGFDLTCAFRSSVAVDRPDIQGVLMPMALDTDAPRPRLARHSGAMFLGWQMRPTTTSTVHAGGPSPDDPPIIGPRYIETDGDRAAVGPVLDWARALFAHGALADMVESEVAPGPSVSSHDDVVRFARSTHFGLYHAVGAAAMGPADDDVVDDRLRVRGVDGLRVVDASVFAEHPSASTAAPTMALAWRAADLIREGG
jgi:choline dehydrogenase-like flavoprotein